MSAILIVLIVSILITISNSDFIQSEFNYSTLSSIYFFVLSGYCNMNYKTHIITNRINQPQQLYL